MSRGSQWKRQAATMACALACLLPAAPAADKEPQSAATLPSIPPGIEIRVEALPKIATVGDAIRLDLDVAAPANYRIEVQKPDPPTGDFFVREFFPGPDLPESTETQMPAKTSGPPAGGTVHHRARVVLAIYKTGKFVIPPIPVKIKTAEGKEISLLSPPADVEIRSVLQGKDPALKDLKKQAELAEPARWLWPAIAGAAALLLCGIGWYFWRKRRKPSTPPPAVQPQNLLDIAETDLRALLARGLPGSGHEKQFYVGLSEIVKKILEAGYAIHTAELTTSEIMDALNVSQSAEPTDKKRIESFLNRCDVVKFAKYIPGGTENEAAGQDALRILEEARKIVSRRQLVTGSPNEE